jgi:hypothetical protein
MSIGKTGRERCICPNGSRSIKRVCADRQDKNYSDELRIMDRPL